MYVMSLFFHFFNMFTLISKEDQSYHSSRIERSNYCSNNCYCK